MTDVLGPLAEASAFHEPLVLDPAERALDLAALRSMHRIRAAEERIAENVATGVIKCPCHLAIGQEAPAVAAAEVLSKQDRAFGAHRSHAHFLAMGGSLEGLFAEVLGRQAGVSHGMGGSMHLRAQDVGFYGSVPIVGATIPIAVGAALAAKREGGTAVGVSFLGDGATEEGVFHESLNFAAVMSLPVLFVCENNLFSSHLHISERQPRDRVARFAQAHAVAHETVDGNDIVAMRRVLREAMAVMRGPTRAPFFLECVTYRWMGHVGHRADEDVGVARKDVLATWRKRDPIGRLAESLIVAGALTPTAYEAMQRDIAHENEAAWTKALAEPFPPASALLERVWGAPR
jgi:pyruvate dehydrogenase E1 component alpha subunit